MTNCHQLKLIASDGKMHTTDAADAEQILRLIQSIPSKTRKEIEEKTEKIVTDKNAQMMLS